MKLFFLTSFLLGAQLILAQYTQVKYQKRKEYNIKQWEVIDISVKAREKEENSFINSSFVKFENTEGETLNIPLIYNGDKEWLIRFSNKKKGTWNYTIESNLKSINNKSGTIIVVPNTTHKGSVELSATDKHNLSYETGARYTPLAFECDWIYALDYHNNKALPKTNHLLNLIEENGFNQIVMNVFSYDVRWDKDEKLKKRPDHEYGAPQDIFPFLGNNSKPDYTSLNIDFFKKFDRTILALHDREIQAHIMIYVWNKLVAWPEQNTVADNMYYDYVIKRYQAFPNILWDVSKEALYYGRADETYISERITRIRKNDAYKRLVTVHDYGFCNKHSEEVDYISSQNWRHDMYNQMQNIYTKFKNKPVFNIEHGGYEASDYVVFPGAYTNAEACLRRNYMCLFAGAGTTYYWQGTSWNVLIYNPFEDDKVIYKPKFEYFKHLSNLWKKFEKDNLQPQPGKNSNGYCLANKTGLSLHYVPKELFQIKVGWLFKKKNKNKKKTYYWFNTLTGETTPEKSIEKRDYKNPWKQEADAILITHITD